MVRLGTKQFCRNTKNSRKGLQARLAAVQSQDKNFEGSVQKSERPQWKDGWGGISCKFYTKLDNILRHRPASVPNILLDAGTGVTGSSTEFQQCDNEPGDRGEFYW